ncbi:hypothetical protein D7X94_08505, partial [Acutalibacter sp. 1XD8-33]|uniref:hypothetical protein n=1 Tax=Acutalibacter sp. 1XD8-33 TaxID=2320081 RepID=UPI000ECEF3D6
ALDVLDLPEEEVSAADKLWAVLRPELVDEMILHEFACWCAEEALASVQNPDPRSVAAVEAKRKWMRGETTDRQLEKAREAARDATRDAAEYAAWCAARRTAMDAAWCAAMDAARCAAECAARYSDRCAAECAAWCAARDSARRAAWCVAWNDARRKQVQMLRELLGNG